MKCITVLRATPSEIPVRNPNNQLQQQVGVNVDVQRHSKTKM